MRLVYNTIRLDSINLWSLIKKKSVHWFSCLQLSLSTNDFKCCGFFFLILVFLCLLLHLCCITSHLLPLHAACRREYGIKASHFYTQWVTRVFSVSVPEKKKLKFDPFCLSSSVFFFFLVSAGVTFLNSPFRVIFICLILTHSGYPPSETSCFSSFQLALR